jgi:plasmid stabilization system protein ParE
MKRYAVTLTAEAENDLADAFQWELNESDERALRWRDALLSELRSLQTLPARCPVMEEYSSANEEPVRRKIFATDSGTYIIYFRIKQYEDLVQVLFCRHASRKPLDPRAM